MVWAATENGLLICRTNGGWRTVSTQTNWPGVESLMRGGGCVWCAVDRDARPALYCLRDGQFQIFKPTDGLLSRVQRGLLADPNGDLWVTGTGVDSLQCVRGGKLETIKLPPEVQMIHAMAQTSDGDVY